MERKHGVRWADLARLEPELGRLLHVARLVGDGCRTWRDVERGWTQFKDDVARLTWRFNARGHPCPGGVAVYDVIYWKLHNAVARDRRGGD
ncbi:MAG: hypothetical protein C0501_29615 [Isosphaera sp.]|nr:hypothetical protein [Isosphaera sp.]